MVKTKGVKTEKGDAAFQPYPQRESAGKKPIPEPVVTTTGDGAQPMVVDTPTTSSVSSSPALVVPARPKRPAPKPPGTMGDRDYTKPWKRHPNEGAYTGNPRPRYPTVFRPYGSNTRQRVVGDRSSVTRMHHLGYAKGIVESLSVPPLLAPSAPLGQSGSAAVNHAVPALRRGAAHLLFTSG